MVDARGWSRFVDPGWPFVIAGLAMAAAAVLVPSQNDLDELQSMLARLDDADAFLAGRLRAHAEFLDDLDRADETLIRRLAALQFNVSGEHEQPLIIARAPSASVGDWIDAGVAASGQAPGASRLAVSPRASSTLSRITDGPDRLWILGGSVFAIFVGIVLGPSASTVATGDGPNAPDEDAARSPVQVNAVTHEAIIIDDDRNERPEERTLRHSGAAASAPPAASVTTLVPARTKSRIRIERKWPLQLEAPLLLPALPAPGDGVADDDAMTSPSPGIARGDGASSEYPAADGDPVAGTGGSPSFNVEDEVMSTTAEAFEPAAPGASEGGSHQTEFDESDASTLPSGGGAAGGVFGAPQVDDEFGADEDDVVDDDAYDDAEDDADVEYVYVDDDGNVIEDEDLDEYEVVGGSEEEDEPDVGVIEDDDDEDDEYEYVYEYDDDDGDEEDDEFDAEDEEDAEAPLDEYDDDDDDEEDDEEYEYEDEED